MIRALAGGAARAAYRARGFYPANVAGHDVRVDPDHVGFWREVAAGRWEPRTLAFLDDALPAGAAFVDVGAWIGPVTLFASRTCRRVYSFEPDPVAYRYLLWNLHLNPRGSVVPFHAALGAATGMRRMSGRGYAFGQSRSSFVLPGGPEPEIEVYTISWADWLEAARPGRLDCIKMDIEGGEFELLPAMRTYLASEKPSLHVSFHAGLLRESEREARLEQALDALGVYDSWRDERGAPVRAAAAAEEIRSGDCSFTFRP